MEYSLKDAPLYPDSFKPFINNITSHSVNLPVGLLQDSMFFVLLLFFICYVSVSSVLFYHWHTYGMKNKMIVSAQLLFTIVSLILFWTALILVTR